MQTNSPEIIPLLVTTAQAVEVLNLSKTRVFALISDGTIASARIGKRRMIVYASLTAFVGTLTQQRTISIDLTKGWQ